MHQATVLFDINETLLDLSALKPKFATLFGHEQYTETWFAMLLHASTVCVNTKVKTDFAELASIALQTLADKHRVSLSTSTSTAILGSFATLPAHIDVKEALTTLKQAGFRVVALSNSSQSLLDTQISNAGLATHFDQLISVQSAQTFKPDSKAYQFAAQTLNRQPDEMRLVACHDWDIHGALSAGLKGAFIRRHNTTYHPLYHQADIIGDDLRKIAEQIIATDIQ